MSSTYYGDASSLTPQPKQPSRGFWGGIGHWFGSAANDIGKGVSNFVAAMPEFFQRAAVSGSDPLGNIKRDVGIGGHMLQQGATAASQLATIQFHPFEAQKVGEAAVKGFEGKPLDMPTATTGEQLVGGVSGIVGNLWGNYWKWHNKTENAMGNFVAHPSASTFGEYAANVNPLGTAKGILSGNAQAGTVQTIQAATQPLTALPKMFQYSEYLRGKYGNEVANRYLTAAVMVDVGALLLTRRGTLAPLTEEEIAAVQAAKGETTPIAQDQINPNIIGQGIIRGERPSEFDPFVTDVEPVTNGPGVTDHPDIPMLNNFRLLSRNQLNEMGQVLYENFQSIRQIEDFYREVHGEKITVPKTLANALERRWRLDRMEGVRAESRTRQMQRAQEMAAEQGRDFDPITDMPPEYDEFADQAGRRRYPKIGATTHFVGKYLVRPPAVVAFQGMNYLYQLGTKMAPGALAGYYFAKNIDPNGWKQAIANEPEIGQFVLGLQPKQSDPLSNVINFFVGFVVPDPLAWSLGVKATALSAEGFAGLLGERWGGTALRTPGDVDRVYRQYPSFRASVHRLAGMDASQIVDQTAQVLSPIANRLEAATTDEAVLAEIKRAVVQNQFHAPEGVMPVIKPDISAWRATKQQEIRDARRAVVEGESVFNLGNRARLKFLQTGYTLRTAFDKQATYIDLRNGKMEGFSFELGQAGKPALKAIQSWMRMAYVDENIVRDVVNQLARSNDANEWARIIQNMHNLIVTNRVHAFMPADEEFSNQIIDILKDKTRGMFGAEQIGKNGSYATGKAASNDNFVMSNDKPNAAAINERQLAPGHLPPVKAFNRMMKATGKAYKLYQGNEKAMSDWIQVLRSDPEQIIAQLGDVIRLNELTPRALLQFVDARLAELSDITDPRYAHTANAYQEIRQKLVDAVQEATGPGGKYAITTEQLVSGELPGKAEVIAAITRTMRDHYKQVLKDSETDLANGQRTVNQVDRLNKKIETQRRGLEKLNSEAERRENELNADGSLIKQVPKEELPPKVLQRFERNAKWLDKLAERRASFEDVINAHVQMIADINAEFAEREARGEVGEWDRPGDEVTIIRNVPERLRDKQRRDFEFAERREQDAQKRLETSQRDLRNLQNQRSRLFRGGKREPAKMAGQLQDLQLREERLRSNIENARKEVKDAREAQNKTGLYRVKYPAPWNPLRAIREHPLNREMRELANRLGVDVPDPLKPFNVPEPETETYEQWLKNLSPKEFADHRAAVRASADRRSYELIDLVDMQIGNQSSLSIPRRYPVVIKGATKEQDKRSWQFVMGKGLNKGEPHPLKDQLDYLWSITSEKERRWMANPKNGEFLAMQGQKNARGGVRIDDAFDLANNIGLQHESMEAMIDRWVSHIREYRIMDAIAKGRPLPREADSWVTRQEAVSGIGGVMTPLEESIEENLIQHSNIAYEIHQELKQAHETISADIKRIQAEVDSGAYQPWPRAQLGPEPQNMDVEAWYSEVDRLLQQRSEIMADVFDADGLRVRDFTPQEELLARRLDELIPTYVVSRLAGASLDNFADAEMVYSMIKHVADEERFGRASEPLLSRDPNYVRSKFHGTDDPTVWRSPDEVEMATRERLAAWTEFNGIMNDRLSGLSPSTFEKSQQQFVKNYQAAKAYIIDEAGKVIDPARGPGGDPNQAAHLGKIGNYIYSRAAQRGLLTSFATKGQVASDLLDEMVNNTYFKPMALASMGYPQRVGLSEAFLNAARFGPMKFMDAAIKSAGAKANYQLSNSEIKAIKTAWYGLVSGIAEPILAKDGTELAERALELLALNNGHIVSGAMDASHGAISRQETADWFNIAHEGDLMDNLFSGTVKATGKVKSKGIVSPGFVDPELILHNWYLTLSQRASSELTIDIAQIMLDGMDRFVFNGQIDVAAAQAYLIPRIRERLLQMPADQRARFARSKLSTPADVAEGKDPLTSWSGALARDLINLTSGRGVEGQIATRFHRQVLTGLAEGNPISVNYLNKMVLSRNVEGKLEINIADLPDNLANIESAVIEPGVFRKYVDKFGNVNQRKFFAPIVNSLARNPTYLLEYTKEMRVLQDHVDAKLMTLDEAQMLAQTRATLNMAKYIHNPQDRTRWEMLMGVVAPFYFAKNQAYRRMYRLAQSDPAAFEYYFKNMGAMSNFVATSVQNGISQTHIPGSELMGTGVAMMWGARGFPLALSGRLSSIASMDPMAEGGDFSGGPVQVAWDLLRPNFGPIVTIPTKLVAQVILPKMIHNFLPDSVQPEMLTALQKVTDETLGSVGANTPIWYDLLPNTLVRNIVVGVAGGFGIPGGFGNSYIDAEREATKMVVEGRIASIESSLIDKHPQWSRQFARVEAERQFSYQMRNKNERDALMGHVNSTTATMWVVKTLSSYALPVSTILKSSQVDFSPELWKCIKKAGSVVEGYRMFHKLYPDHDLDAVFKSVAKDGSFGGPTTKVGEFIKNNGQFVHDNPNASRWLIKAGDKSGPFDANTYKLELNLGIRSKDAPREFLDRLVVACGENYQAYVFNAVDEAIKSMGDMDPETLRRTRGIAYGAADNIITKYAVTNNPLFYEQYGTAKSQQKALQNLADVTDMFQKTKERPANVDRVMWNNLKETTDAANAFLADYNSKYSYKGSSAAAEARNSWHAAMDALAKKHPDLSDYFTQVLRKIV